MLQKDEDAAESKLAAVRSALQGTVIQTKPFSLLSEKVREGERKKTQAKAGRLFINPLCSLTNQWAIPGI